MSDLPQSQIEEAHKLEQKALVELFQIDLYPPGVGTLQSLFLCNHQAVTWQGITWSNSTACKVSETSSNVSGEVDRPKFSIVNMEGIWSEYVHQGYVNNAIVKRFRVLSSDILANNNAYALNQWRMSKVISLSRSLLVVELRTALDGHNFKIPSETYRPPKYPAVSVQ